MRIIFSDAFKKQFKKCPREIKDIFYEKVDLFRNNFRHPSLRIHKIDEKKGFSFSLSINMSYRAKFVKDKDLVEFFAVGLHDQVYR